MTAGDLVVREAVRDLGVREATGHNDGEPAALYMRGDRLAWCAAAVWTWHRRAGVRIPWGYWPSRNVAVFETQAQRAGKWFLPTRTPEPGDCVFYEWRMESDDGPGGRHMGIVESVDTLSGVLHTIEGNVGNEVRRCTRHLDSPSITGFARLWA